ncbi:MAG: hypothetical protein IPH94_04135 [Saprospiraceae bacterium]|mgnify:CR=1 FL=1|jgi:hypothetical protein|nr:hypothetical protein [Saprospiraceae bacterium]MBK7220544.1 hypothetical protein [Saprospiraceae bacterium]MBK7790825.1 hypothetical protein [Saprospiraceae bacterium]MBK8109426.1 hypothetical protein [Saprospiraceae bacterium]MBK8848957.1 hypothetical protein [Saprospiraceae bacterium]
MDFRMDKSSWGMLGFMFLTMVYFLVTGAGDGIDVMGYLLSLLLGIATVAILVALASIPVLIYCYFVKVIPDIDYSIRVAFVFTLIGIASEFFM